MADDPTPQPDPTPEPEPTVDPTPDPTEEPKPGPVPTPPAAKPAAGDDDEFKSEASKKSVLADLNRERTTRQALEAEIAAIRQQNETDQDKRIREAIEAARLEGKPAIVDAKAESAFLMADARPERISALTKFLDLEKIEIKGRTVTGLADQVEALKTEYPEFFKAEKPTEEAKKTTPKIPVANKPPADQPRTVGERIAAQLGQQ